MCRLWQPVRSWAGICKADFTFNAMKIGGGIWEKGRLQYFCETGYRKEKAAYGQESHGK